ncbi:alpha/beta fold hydrolase [Rheinheimera riviphila]|uniref:Alpha/beta fold hydrolase n=1 Tax=Rheinheimera riviphila TaxID=1834037 RepID=A0A437R0L2_9GAMM|nr:alpha/beta fold hydrolase [Rheinheimera riviphila]RVU40299.1 alpha/beta fold hydrolase [Rheinheimera riviphila]
MMQWPEFKAQLSSGDFASSDDHSTRATLALAKRWQQATHGTFDSVSKLNNHSAAPNQLQLHFSYWQPAGATAALVLIPGRIEAGHKYLELINEALHAGYQVYVLDHQGQGASGRLDDQSQIGDVRDFDDYVADLANFIQQIIKPKTKLPLLALAHSMGGGILCRYLQQERQQELQLEMQQKKQQQIPQQPHHGLAAAIFCSPMWGIPTHPLPHVLALPLSRVVSQLNQLCSQQSWYIPGQGPYQNRPFLDNDLSQCVERYQWFRSLYQQFPAYQLGGISWRWLAQALAACQQMQKDPAPQLPCLLLQAGADQVVDNAAQTKLWQRFSQSSGWSALSAQHLLADARHEILFETDKIRGLALSKINQFLQTLPVTGS